MEAPGGQLTIARLEIRRFCLQPEELVQRCAQPSAGSVGGSVQLYVSFTTPRGVEISLQGVAANQQTDEKGVRRVQCAANTNLMDVSFVVTQLKTDGIQKDGCESVKSVMCQVWYSRAEQQEQVMKGGGGEAKLPVNNLVDGDWSSFEDSPPSSITALPHVEDEEKLEEKAPAAVESHWEVLADVSLEIMKYGVQTVNFAMGDVAKEYTSASLQASIFIEPKLLAVEIEEAAAPLATKPPVETTQPGLPPDNNPLSLDHGTAPSTGFAEERCGEATSAPSGRSTAVGTGEAPVCGAGVVEVPKGNMEAATQEQADTMVVVLAEQPKHMGARWLLLLDMSRWDDCEPNGSDELKQEKVNVATQGAGDATSRSVVEGGILFRLVLCGADANVLAYGSPFSGSLCRTSGWSDALLAVGDDIVACSVVSVKLQMFNHNAMPNCQTDAEATAEPLQLNNTSREAAKAWVTVASSQLVPIASLLASLKESSMLPIPLTAVDLPSAVAPPTEFVSVNRGQTISAQASLVRVPAVVGETKSVRHWMRTIRIATDCFFRKSCQTLDTVAPPSEISLPKECEWKQSGTGWMCSVELNVSAVVLQKVVPYVDAGAAWPVTALSVSGGCEILLEETKMSDIFFSAYTDNEWSETRRSPVSHFDTVVQATVNETHPVVLITLHSSVSQEVLFGHAVFAPLGLRQDVGHVWLPLQYKNHIGYHKHGEDDSSPTVGWVHCSYICVFSSAGASSSSVTAGNEEVLQQPVLFPSPLSVPKYIASPCLTPALRWNSIEVCIVKASDLRIDVNSSSRCSDGKGGNDGGAGGNVEGFLHASVQLLPKSDLNPFVTPAASYEYPHWNSTCRVGIAAAATHLIVQVLVGDGRGGEGKSVGIVDITRVATSGFWTTASCDGVWLPLVSNHSSGGERRYCGSLFIRWSFGCVGDLSKEVVIGMGAALRPTWSNVGLPSASTAHNNRFDRGHWLRLERVEVQLPWRLWHMGRHCEARWREVLGLKPTDMLPDITLRLQSGDFTHESNLVLLSAGGFGFCLREAVFLPLTDNFNVVVCFRYHGNTLASETPGGKTTAGSEICNTVTVAEGELSLSAQDRVDLLTYRQQQSCRRIFMRVHPRSISPHFNIPFGLLTAEVTSSVIKRNDEIRWTWPQPHIAASVELQLGKVFSLRRHDSKDWLPATANAASPRWIVNVRETGSACPEQEGSNKERVTGILFGASPRAAVLRGGCSTRSSAVSNFGGLSSQHTGDAAEKLYLHWPPAPPGADHRRRPPPPTIELSLSRIVDNDAVDVGGDSKAAPKIEKESTVNVGVVTLNLARCFSDSSGSSLYELHHPQTPPTVAEGRPPTIGYVELHYLHNFAQDNNTNRGGQETGKVEQEQHDRCSRHSLLLLTVVGARYRERGQISAAPVRSQRDGKEGVSVKTILTSFVVGVGHMSWHTSKEVGMTPHFGSTMLFERPYSHTGEDADGERNVVTVRLQMLAESSSRAKLGSPDREVGGKQKTCLRGEQKEAEMLPTSFALLHLNWDTVPAAVMERMRGCWLPLFTAAAQIDGSYHLSGEVLVQWSWFDPSYGFWRYALPLSVNQISPMDCTMASVPQMLAASEDHVETPASSFPSYLSIYIDEFTFSHNVVVETPRKDTRVSLIVSVCVNGERGPLSPPSLTASSWTLRCTEGEADSLKVCYGDCTGATPFETEGKRSRWRERCILPFCFSGDAQQQISFQLRHGWSPFSTVGEGWLSWKGTPSQGTYAVPIFVSDASCRNSSDDYQRCGVLMVSVEQGPLHLNSMQVTTTVPPPSSNEEVQFDDGKGPQRKEKHSGKHEDHHAMVDGNPSFIVLVDLRVDSVEVDGWNVLPDDGNCLELVVLGDALYNNGKSKQTVRLETACSPFDGGATGWQGLICVQNSSELEVHLYRRTQTVPGNSVEKSVRHRMISGRFVLNLLPSEDGGLCSNSLCVELRQRPMRPMTADDSGSWNYPVGQMHVTCRPLLHSGVLYDPRNVFFQRHLGVELLKLKGVIHMQTEGERARGRRNSKRGRGPLSYVSLHCGAVTVKSLPFTLPSHRHGTFKDVESNDGIDCSGASTPHFTERLVCSPNGATEVRVSLYLENDAKERNDNAVEASPIHNPSETGNAEDDEVYYTNVCLPVGEGAVKIRAPSRDEDGFKSGEVIPKDIWVPFNSADPGRNISALLRYKWFQKVTFGTWLSCIGWRCTSAPLHRPSLIFRLRFLGGELCSLPLDLFDRDLPEQEPTSRHCTVAATAVNVVPSLSSHWSFSYIQLPTIWPLGGRVERVELHDCVTDGFSLLLGVHEWDAVDTQLLTELEGPTVSHDSLEAVGKFPSASGAGHWLSFGEHALLFARSRRPPVPTRSKRLFVPFCWWPVVAEFHLGSLDCSGGTVEAGRLAISCEVILGRWHKNGWVWEENSPTTREAYASQVTVDACAAAVQATWRCDAFDEETFIRQFSVDELRQGRERYAVRTKLVCSVVPTCRFSGSETPSSDEQRETPTTTYVLEAVSAVDDHLANTSGRVSLKLAECGAHVNEAAAGAKVEGSLTLAWSLKHDELALEGTKGESTKVGRILHQRSVSGKSNGKDREEKETSKVTKELLPEWEVVSVEVRNLSVVQDPSRQAPEKRESFDVPVVVQLLASERRRHNRDGEGGAQSPESRKKKSTSPRVSSVFALASTNATPAPGVRQSLLRANITPNWRLEAHEWSDHRKVLMMSLWQMLPGSDACAYALGSLRLDSVVRSAYEQFSSGTPVAEAARGLKEGTSLEQDLVVTDWLPLKRSDLLQEYWGLARLQLRPNVKAATVADASEKNMSRVYEHLPICIELLSASIDSAEDVSRYVQEGRLGLLFVPGCRDRKEGRPLYSSTLLCKAEREVNAEREIKGHGEKTAEGENQDGNFSCSLMATTSIHTLLLSGEVQSGQPASLDGDWLGLFVFLIDRAHEGERIKNKHSSQLVEIVGKGDWGDVLAVQRLHVGQIPKDQPRLSLFGESKENAPTFLSGEVTATFNCESFSVSLRLHIVMLPQATEAVSTGVGSMSDVGGTSPQPLRGNSVFHCIAEGHGEENSLLGNDGVLCMVEGTVYKITEDRTVFMWNARDVSHVRRPSSCSSGNAVALAASRGRPRWVQVSESKGSPQRHSGKRGYGRCMGLTVWAYKYGNDACFLIAECASHHVITLSTLPRHAPEPPPTVQLPRVRNRRSRKRRVISEGSVIAAPTPPSCGSQLHCYNLQQRRWSVLKTEGSSSGVSDNCGAAATPSTRRIFHSTVEVEGKVWLFGGCKLRGEVCGASLDRVGMRVANRVLIASEAALSNELMYLDPSMRVWQSVQPVPSWHDLPSAGTGPFHGVARVSLGLLPPPPVACHAAVHWMGHMFVFGGLCESSSISGSLEPTAELYMFHATHITWWSLSPNKSADLSGRFFECKGNGGWPAARYGHAAAVVPGHPHGAFLILGGAMKVGIECSSQRTNALVDSGRCAHSELLWAYYPALGFWQNISVPLGVPLTRRAFASLQVSQLSSASCSLYDVVLDGGCDAAHVETWLQRRRSKKDEQTLLKKNLNGLLGVVSAFVSAPSLGTAWITLREECKQHIPMTPAVDALCE
ncbi:uncharacterized protein TEOVI_000148200 [Trypanosoma equiperdum]|uniref:Uncharacterized protein n=1 Tax=Trypanosoma equiperdum TaxID=5694 RepID=A0A1G4ICE6_TRYEQ|nr:hypothetical protein, conserved [Trypanosoma equiperdum]